MIEEVLPENMTIRTSYPEKYDELVDEKNLFSRRIHLFTAAFSVGVITNRKSGSGTRPDHDLIRLSTVSDEEQLLLIETLARMGCESDEKKRRGKELMQYADGGLEEIWERYQEIGTLDTSKLVEDMVQQCKKLVPIYLDKIKQKRA